MDRSGDLPAGQGVMQFTCCPTFFCQVGGNPLFMRNRFIPVLLSLFKRGVWRNLRTLTVLILAGAASLHAQFTWTDASGTNHNTSTVGNWSPGQPTSGGDIIFG